MPSVRSRRGQRPTHCGVLNVEDDIARRQVERKTSEKAAEAVRATCNLEKDWLLQRLLRALYTIETVCKHSGADAQLAAHDQLQTMSLQLNYRLIHKFVRPQLH